MKKILLLVGIVASAICSTVMAQAQYNYNPPIPVVPNNLRFPSPSVAPERAPNGIDTEVVSRSRVEIEELVQRLAPQYGLDPNLVLAVIGTESSFNVGAVSPKNAQGLMQLIPETAARFGVRNILDPMENLKGGMAYLQWLLAYFEGNVALVLAGYNAGEHAVEKYQGIPPYTETINYVKKITNTYRNPRHTFSPNITAPSSMLR